MFSILASNYQFQNLGVSWQMIQHDDGNTSKPWVPPHRRGSPTWVVAFVPSFGCFIGRIIQNHPKSTGGAAFYLSRRTVQGTSGILDLPRIQRDRQFQVGLGIFATSSHRPMSAKAARASGANGLTLLPIRSPRFSVFELASNDFIVLPKHLIDCASVPLRTPRKRVCILRSGNDVHLENFS